MSNFLKGLMQGGFLVAFVAGTAGAIVDKEDGTVAVYSAFATVQLLWLIVNLAI